MYLDSTHHAHCCACMTCAQDPVTTANSTAQGATATQMTFSIDVSLTVSREPNFTLEDYEVVVRESFLTWSSVANIDFVEDDNGSGWSHIGVRTTSDPVGGAPDSWGSRGGVIGYGGSMGGERFAWMDDAELWTPYFDRGTSYFLVAVHEIGHAIGLPHNSDGLQVMNPSLGSQKGIYQGDIDAIVARYGAREWTDAAEDVFLKYVKVGQTVDAKGGNDKITATTLADTIYGGGGNDTIDGNAGNDKIYDTLGQNIINAGDNNDVVVGGAGKTTADGGAGNDIIIGGKGDDNLNGGSGNDSIRGDTQSGFFYGDDTITAGAGTDFLEGGGGSDTFVFRRDDGTNTIAELSISGTNPSGTVANGVDFESGVDLIDLRAFNYANQAEAFAKVSDVNGHAQFSDGGTVIIFYGLDTVDLTQSDFLV